MRLQLTLAVHFGDRDSRIAAIRVPGATPLGGTLMYAFPPGEIPHQLDPRERSVEEITNYVRSHLGPYARVVDAVLEEAPGRSAPIDIPPP